MIELIRVFKEGYKSGIDDALKYKIRKKFRYINVNYLKSKLYDLGYIKGYNYIIKKSFNK